MKKKIKFFFFFCILVAPIGYLYYSNLINLKEIETLIKEKYNFILLSLVFYFLSLCVSIFRYQYILKKFEVKVKFKILFQIQVVCTFFSQVLPFSIVASEVFKIYFISKFYKIKEWNKITFATFYDKSIGLSGFFFLSFFISIFFINYKFEVLQNLNFLVTILLLILSLMLYFMPRILNMIKLKKFNYNFKYSKEIVLGITSSFFFCTSYYLVFLTTEVEISLGQVILVMPLLILSYIIPMGILGFGGYQIVSIYLFSFIVSNKELIASVSVIFSLITVITNIFLGLIFIVNNFNVIKKFFNLKKL